MKRINLIGFLLLFLCLAAAVFYSIVRAQQGNDATRKLWDTAYTSNSKSSTKRRTYRIATPKVPVNDVAPDSVVGVTLWRLRPATARDSGERIIVHDDSDAKEYLPERISPETKLGQGDKLRISVEGARNGYLYVVDREQYADGTLGPPYLIFPTTRTLNGDNKVIVGMLTEIPAQVDSPPFFTLRKSRPDHVAEVLNVVVAPNPIEGITITDKAQQLTTEQVAAWEKQWNSGVGFLEMSQPGQAWTKEERDAAGTRALTPTAPAPQLLFYRTAALANQPMFVKLQLWYRTPSKRTNH
jgi:hypothetical protein